MSKIAEKIGEFLFYLAVGLFCLSVIFVLIGLAKLTWCLLINFKCPF